MTDEDPRTIVIIHDGVKYRLDGKNVWHVLGTNETRSGQFVSSELALELDKQFYSSLAPSLIAYFGGDKDHPSIMHDGQEYFLDKDRRWHGLHIGDVTDQLGATLDSLLLRKMLALSANSSGRGDDLKPPPPPEGVPMLSDTEPPKPARGALINEAVWQVIAFVACFCVAVVACGLFNLGLDLLLPIAAIAGLAGMVAEYLWDKLVARRKRRAANGPLWPESSTTSGGEGTS